MNPLMSFRIALIAGGLIASFFLGYKIEEGRWDAEKVRIQNEAIEHENQIIQQQGEIAQKSNEAKDELQARYDAVITMYRDSVLNNTGSANGNSPASIPAQGLRLLEPDAEILIGFARACAQSELERNEVIEKYEALSK